MKRVLQKLPRQVAIMVLAACSGVIGQTSLSISLVISVLTMPGRIVTTRTP